MAVGNGRSCPGRPRGTLSGAVAASTFLPHMRTSIRTGRSQARNPAALLRFPISNAAALRRTVIVSQSAGIHISGVLGVVGRDQA